MSEKKVAIMMGSKSDIPVMEAAKNILEEFGIGCDFRVLSAHRTPKETVEYAEHLEDKGFKVVICGAGMSAALPGVVAAHTTLPVIGVPIDASLMGLDSLLSTVQMPPGVPVGAVAIGKAGAKNAGYLALRILALSDEALGKKLVKHRDDQRKQILNGG